MMPKLSGAWMERSEVSCNRIVLMRLIVHAAMLFKHGCFSYAPHMRRICAAICAAVARMNLRWCMDCWRNATFNEGFGGF